MPNKCVVEVIIKYCKKNFFLQNEENNAIFTNISMATFGSKNVHSAVLKSAIW